MYHIPVLAKEATDFLVTNESGVYVDLTFGGGGYAALILSKVKSGKLYAFDQDPDALVNVDDRFDEERFQFVAANFRHLKRFLKLYGVKSVDGIVADLGVSSYQFDQSDRGFSFRLGGDLDMRMSSNGELTAATVLNEYDEAQLHQVFGEYGEVKNAKTLAALIVRERSVTPFKSIEQLKLVLGGVAPKNREYKYYAQVFQALRIEVNQEMAALKDLLEQVPDVLIEGGRLVVVSYHSLEDRLIKNFMAKGKFRGELDKDIYGNNLRPLEPVIRKAIIPSEEEINRNSRARSAKLRVAERNEQQWPKTQ